MYYNTKTNQLLNSCPGNGVMTITENIIITGPDGTTTETSVTRDVLIQGLELTDFETIKACGILPVKSDSPTQPENSYEDISQRNVVVEDDGVIVTRVYLPNPITVPPTISARQVRLWLIDNDISLTSVENAINSIINETLREKTLVEWEFAPYIERNHPLIQTIGNTLGLTSEQIDQGFIAASQL